MVTSPTNKLSHVRSQRFMVSRLTVFYTANTSYGLTVKIESEINNTPSNFQIVCFRSQRAYGGAIDLFSKYFAAQIQQRSCIALAELWMCLKSEDVITQTNRGYGAGLGAC